MVLTSSVRLASLTSRSCFFRSEMSVTRTIERP
jgi:hypothetical protein